jgi:uncharacterized membrane protein YkoI
MRIQFVAAMLLTTIALLPTTGKTETRDGAVAVASKAGAPQISKEQATQNALAALPGEVTDATIEKKRGKNVWVIEIVAAKDGAETDVLVDMNTGTVIGFDH